MKNVVVVVGAGPAGMMAAITAAANGAAVTLLEKKERAGKKLSITGKGRCNITSAVERQELVKGFPGNGRFLYSAFNQFGNQELIQFFNSQGLATVVERGQRVFPQSGKANEVVAILEKNLQQKGVSVVTSWTVRELVMESGEIIGVRGSGGYLPAAALVVATGGMSYPGTGSTGDGYLWARRAGHNVIEPRPGLVPLVVGEKWVRELQGLSLKNTRATAFNAQGQKINTDCGELLFTHFGLSGPIILSLSRDIGEYIYRTGGPVTVELDLKPALSEEKLDQRLRRDLEKFSRKLFKNSLDDLLPRKMIPVVVKLSGIDPEKECHQITRQERQNLLHLLKHFSLTVTGTRPISEAIVTAGGVNTKEVDPHTMESHLVKNLFFAGEILDVDGYTGGYNLQAAFSTGYVAGKYAALRVSKADSLEIK